MAWKPNNHGKWKKPIGEWEAEQLSAYAAQAALAAKDALLVNPLDNNPISHGGAFRFRNGKVTNRIPFDSEQILIVDVE